jgi:hypothetical protein
MARRQSRSSAACTLSWPETKRCLPSIVRLDRLRGSQVTKILRLPGPVGVGPADHKIIWMKVPA